MTKHSKKYLAYNRKSHSTSHALYQMTWRRALTLSLCLTASGATSAQDLSRPSLIEEILVTAQKREESLQDVPVSVISVQGDAFETAGITDVGSLDQMVSNMQIAKSTGPRSFGFFIRGVGTSTFNTGTIEPSSAFVVDGVVMGLSSSALSDLPDIERVEVLRGPQGTLFGKSASSGVVQIITRDPTDEFMLKAGITYADPLDELNGHVSVSGAIADTITASLTGRFGSHDGLIKNIPNGVPDGREFGDRDDYGFRSKVIFNPADGMTFKVIADYYQSDTNCCIWTSRSLGPNPNGLADAGTIGAGIVPSEDNTNTSIGGNVRTTVESKGVSFHADMNVSDALTLSYIGSSRELDLFNQNDADSSPVLGLDINRSDFVQSQNTHELRLASAEATKLEWVAGLYYFEQNINNDLLQIFGPDVYAFLGTRNSVIKTQTMHQALFGQGTYHVTDRLALILGARVSDESVDSNKIFNDPTSGVLAAYSAKKTDTGSVYRFGTQYDISDNIMGFATYTRGYKAGGVAVTLTNSDYTEVEPEIPSNFEIGLRSDWFDGNMILNATAFYTTIEDFQIQSRPPGQQLGFITSNAAEVKSKGLEIELLSRPTDDLTINLNMALLDAAYDSFSGAACFPGQTVEEGCNRNGAGDPLNGTQDLSGFDTLYAPNLSASLDVGYTFDLGGLAGKVTIGSSYRDDSMVYANNPTDSGRQEAYALVRGRVSLETQDGRYRVSLFGRNLADKRYATMKYGTSFGSQPGGVSQFLNRDSARVIGISLEMSI